MTFIKLFFICTFKDPKLAKKINQFDGKSKKKLNSADFVEFVFSKSGIYYMIHCLQREEVIFQPGKIISVVTKRGILPENFRTVAAPVLSYIFLQNGPIYFRFLSSQISQFEDTPLHNNFILLSHTGINDEKENQRIEVGPAYAGGGG